MEEQRARFVSRSASGGTASGSSSNSCGSGSGMQSARSQWHGMDLHTTTPSSHRRAMYISPVPAPAVASPCATNAPGTSGDASRQRAEAAALSARNQVLHRRLSERKRFDSADYAMKMVRRAMQSDSSDTSPPSEGGAPSPMVASPPSSGSTGSGPAVLQSPRLSPSHGRLVFAHALKNVRDGDMDVEMQDVSNNQEMGSPSPQPAARIAPNGPLQTAAKSVSAAMSARNILIQKKLQEKRHFDSADYQLARLGVATDVVMEDVGCEPALDRSALPFARTPAPMTLHVAAVASSPVNSPSAARAAVLRSNQMSPSVRASSGPTGFGGRGGPGKYGNLGAMGSSGQMANGKYGNMGGRAASGNPQQDLRRNTLLRQQENFIAAQNPATPSVPGPQQQKQPTPASTSGPPQKYGKLVAANILFRKNLKDRQRFDSADYQMEAAKQQAQRSGETSPGRTDNNAPQSSDAKSSASNQDDEPSSPVLKPQAKHIKLSDEKAAGGWATHVKAATTQQNQQESSGRGGWAMHPAVAAAQQTRRDDGARLAARSVLLNRKLSEGKKRFDSGEYFAAKDKAARAASNRAEV